MAHKIKFVCKVNPIYYYVINIEPKRFTPTLHNYYKTLIYIGVLRLYRINKNYIFYVLYI